MKVTLSSIQHCLNINGLLNHSIQGPERFVCKFMLLLQPSLVSSQYESGGAVPLRFICFLQGGELQWEAQLCQLTQNRATVSSQWTSTHGGQYSSFKCHFTPAKTDWCIASYLLLNLQIGQIVTDVHFQSVLEWGNNYWATCIFTAKINEERWKTTTARQPFKIPYESMAGIHIGNKSKKWELILFICVGVVSWSSYF